MTDDHRKSKRHRCKMPVRVYAGQRCIDGSIIDISARGLCIQADDAAAIWPGTAVEIQNYEIGRVSGTVAWQKAGRLGISLSISPEMRRQFEAFEKFYRVELG